MKKLILILAFLSACPVYGQTTVTGRITTGTLANRPATCSTGDQYNTTDGNGVFVCSSINTWAVFGICTTALENVVSDAFNRTAGNLGANWTDYANSFAPTAGLVSGTNAGTYNVSAYTGGGMPTSLAQEAWVGINTYNSTGGTIGPAVSISGTAHSNFSYYACVAYRSGPNLQLIKVTSQNDAGGGTVNVLNSTSITPADGDVITLRRMDNTLVCLMNKNAITIEYTDNSSPLAAGYPGMQHLGSTGTIYGFRTLVAAAPSAANINIVVVGDSKARGASVVMPWPNNLRIKGGSGAAYVTNQALSGSAIGITVSAPQGGTMESMLTSGTDVIDGLYQAGKLNILVMDGGTNDIGSGRTYSQVLTDLQTWVTARKAAHPWKIVIVPMASRGPSTGTQLDYPAKAFNAGLAALTGVDAIVNYPQGIVGTGAAFDTNLFLSDQLHPTQLAGIIEGDAVSAAINSLF